jgi:hypothetical protein
LQRNVATAGYAFTLQKREAVGLLRGFYFFWENAKNENLR